MKPLPIGISDFKKLKQQGCFFVDKTLMIKEILDNSSEVILLPRPRRFGKTLNMSMLRYFLENENIEENLKLFEDTAIISEKVYETHFGKYPVIFFSFKGIKDKNWDSASDSMNRLIASEYQRFFFVTDSDKLTKFEKSDFQLIANLEASQSAFKTSLFLLSKCLFNYYKQKPVIIIDEYDTPIHTSWYEKYYEEMISFMKTFLGEGLKDNPFIYKGVITGILRIARESIFSELNNLSVYTLLSQEHQDHFGFNQEEVDILLEDSGLLNMRNPIREWYNGYIFGNQEVYNPWSIINFVAGKDKRFKSFWVHTSSNDILRSLLKDNESNIKTELLDLLKGNSVIKNIDENIVFPDLQNNETTIYSFLLFTGYLKAKFIEKLDLTDYYELSIPNEEVKIAFRKVIESWMNESFGNSKLQAMLKALVSGNIGVFEQILSEFVLTTLSYFDTKGKNEEKVYQAFILGMLINLSTEYEINSEKESGFGRYDIAVLPRDKKKKAIIMELKKLDVFHEETKEVALESALKQIEEKHYEAGIRAKGHNEILKMAVTFEGKRCWVKTA